MIGPLAEAGHRVLAPDLIGFGRSDKPTRSSDYTYLRHVEWVTAWLTGLDLRDITWVRSGYLPNSDGACATTRGPCLLPGGSALVALAGR